MIKQATIPSSGDVHASGGAGAPDVVVTRPMIQAGLAVFDGAVGVFPEEILVSRIYSAMRTLEGPQPHAGSDTAYKVHRKSTGRKNIVWRVQGGQTHDININIGGLDNEPT